MSDFPGPPLYDYDDGSDGDVDVSFGAFTGSFLGIIPATEKFELYAKVGGYIGDGKWGQIYFGNLLAA